MEKNIGPQDKVIRIIIAAVLLIIGFTYSAILGLLTWVLYLIAVILIVTVITGHCLPYKWLKINTNKANVRERPRVIAKTIAKKPVKKKKR
jgi:amino acid transporter